MRDFLLMAVVQFTQYVVLTINFRAIANEQYLWAGGTAATASLLGYTIVKRIVRDDTRYGMAGMMVGGALADMTGIFLTRSW